MSGVVNRPKGLRHDDERGLSLPELLVAMMVLAIVMVIVSSFFANGTQVLAKSDAVGRSTGVASNVMNEATRVIRSGTNNEVEGSPLVAPAFIGAFAESLTLFSAIDSPSNVITPAIVRLEIDAAGNFVEKRWAHTSTNGDYFLFSGTAGAPTSRRVLGGPLGRVAAGNAPLFSYRTAAGVLLTVPSSGLSEADRRTIAEVLVTVSVDADSDPRTPPVVVENAVRLPQLGFTED